MHHHYEKCGFSSFYLRLINASIAISLFSLFIPSLPLSAQSLDSAYHSPADLLQEIEYIRDNYPEWVKVDTIGYGGFYGEPILLVKLSDNPDVIEREPPILIIGQVHAEEIIGVELTIKLMRALLDNLDDPENGDRLSGLELYFIPTLNPDGFRVVHSGDDITFRKNCRDNIGDGRLRLRQGIGRDSSGVDLNRNFGLHWDRGDTLYQPRGNNESYNYYRGPEPFSEPETVVLRDLMLERKFLFAISYHSSRSGRNSELVIGPWSWDGRRPPDDDAISALGGQLAVRLPRQSGNGNYTSVRATMRVGQEQDWAYQATGTVMYMIEVGADIQPDSAVLNQVVNDNIDAAFFLMDLALGAVGINQYGINSITVRDHNSGAPLPAVVQFGAQLSPLLEPRRADHHTGQAFRFLPAGPYPIFINHPGYRPLALERFDVVSRQSNHIAVSLERSPVFQCTLIVLDAITKDPVSAYVDIRSSGMENPFLFQMEGTEVLELREGFQRFLVRAPGYVPGIMEMQVLSDTALYAFMNPGSALFVEEFDQFREWEYGGQGQRWGIEEFEGRNCLTESFDQPYPSNSSPWIMFNTEVRFEERHSAVIELVHRPYFEPGADFGYVEVYEPYAGRWRIVSTYSSFPPKEWDTTFVSLEGIPLEGSQLRIRLRVATDGAVEEDGWLIDRLAVHYSEEPATVKGSDAPFPGEVQLSAFPSPANGAVQVIISLPIATTGKISLFDEMGRDLGTVREGLLSAGRNQFILDRPDLPSGTYFLVFSDESDAGLSSKVASFLLLR